MTLQKLRRWLGFPLEDRYRVHIEQDIVQSSLRPGIFSALLILAFQAVMMVLSLLRPGGYILADNTLWDGHVTDHAYDHDQQTVGIRHFNDYVAADERVEQLILPMRDGLTLIRKR